jgi:hypothetical protein
MAVSKCVYMKMSLVEAEIPKRTERLES